MDENLGNFEKKLRELITDDVIVNKIISLIPQHIKLPYFYVGDKATLKDDNEEITVTDIGVKHGQYIVYYEIDGDEVYSYEDDFVLK